MPISKLVQAVHEFLDAEVSLEQHPTEDGGSSWPRQAFEQAKRRLTDALADASNVPGERSLVVEADAYLAATLAFDATRTSPLDGVEMDGPARRVERAQQGLQAMLGRYAREAVSHAADRPVTARRVLVGVDGSEPSGWAVDEAGRLAADLGATVQLIHVRPVEDEGDLLLVRPELDRDGPEDRDAGAVLVEGQSRLPAGVQSCIVERSGNAVVHIVGAARRWGADFIVLGTRGRGRLSRLLLGSTAEGVVGASPCPVITVGHAPAALRSGEMTSPGAAEPQHAQT